MSANKLIVTMAKSKHGRLPRHQACLRGLGLNKINQSVEVPNNSETRGMINKIAYMLYVEEL
jgi:large subunit ribosomal protein L30